MTIKPSLVFTTAILMSLVALPTQAAFAPNGPKLVGTGAAGSNQGFSSALSADGNTAIVGGAYDDFGRGAVWVYTRSAGVWSQQGSKLLSGPGVSPFVNFGYSVDLSADGNTAIVGALSDSGGYGAAWIFTRSNGVWTRQSPKLYGTGSPNAAYQGISVGISADGNTALVGGYYSNYGSPGAAWVFTRSGGTWSQQGPMLVGTGAVGAAYQGLSVALSGDGNTALVGGYNDNAGVGAAWVFTRSAGVWSEQGAKLVGTGATGTASQAYAVGLSTDGNTAVLGGFGDAGGTGAVWVFTRNAGTWSQQGPKLVGSNPLTQPYIGTSVAVSGDGNTILAGGPYDNDNAGAAWVFVRNAGVWSQSADKLIGSGANGFSQQGYSVGLSADGMTAILGGPYDGGNIGAAWIFMIAAPKIVTVRDIPNDQGGKVSIRWTAGVLDRAPNNPIDQYWIWRQVPIQSAQAALADGATLVEDGAAASASTGRAFRTTITGSQVYYWEYVGSQVAHGFPAYSYTAATLSDSVAGSNPSTLFMVETERTSTGEYWSSDPDSGYSVDNLHPAAPASLTGNYALGATNLHWPENTEADLAGYRLYRGTNSAFEPSPANLVAAQTDTGYADAGPPGSYYKLSAVDVHGNESGFTLLSPGTTTDVDPAPVSFALGRLVNPVVNGRLAVTFSLSSDAQASLELVDVRGRVLTRRDVGRLGAGSHSILLADGEALSAGVYFVRLAQGAQSARQRVVVLE